MTWTYDPTHLKDSPKDQVRFGVGDTDPDYSYLQDEELDFILEQRNGNVKISILDALERIVLIVAKEVTYKIGPEKVEAKDRYIAFSSMLKTMKREYSYQGKISSVIKPPVFEIGMDDNVNGGFEKWTQL